MSISEALSYFGEKKVRYFYTGLIFAGGVLVLLGILGYRTGSDVPRFWRSTEGRVLYSERAAQDEYIPAVEFTLPQEEKITAPSGNSFRRSLGEGEEVLVRYNPLQPEEIVVERNTLLSYPVYLFFGIVLAGFGFRLFVTSIMRSYRTAFIKENGKRVIPDGITLEETRVRILFVKRRAFYLRCRWKNPLAGPAEGEFVFTGGPYSAPPPLQENGLIGGKKAIVYFLPRGSGNYYIEWRFN